LKFDPVFVVMATDPYCESCQYGGVGSSTIKRLIGDVFRGPLHLGPIWRWKKCVLIFSDKKNNAKIWTLLKMYTRNYKCIPPGTPLLRFINTPLWLIINTALYGTQYLHLSGRSWMDRSALKHEIVCTESLISFIPSPTPTQKRERIGLFPIATARMWNGLPQHVTSAPSLLVFRLRFKFKTRLFTISCPSDPVRDHVHCTVLAQWLRHFGHFNPSCIVTYLLTLYMMTVRESWQRTHCLLFSCEVQCSFNSRLPFELRSSVVIVSKSPG